MYVRELVGALPARSHLTYNRTPPSLDRQDDTELRAKILSLTSSEEAIGDSETEPHDLHMKSRSGRSRTSVACRSMCVFSLGERLNGLSYRRAFMRLL